MDEIKLTGKSEDIVSDNINKLKELFPEIVTEDKIDFEVLKEILGENIDDSKEKYSFVWPGKSQAIKESQKQSTGTLRPCKEESKNWDKTQNIYIEGDNLEVLKLLQKSYYNRIKMIYIDPPYNTGKDFIYPDNYKDNLENYLELTHQVASNEFSSIKLTTNTETSGRFHSDWLNMIYPRLKLAKNLLADDGVIFISIDDNEVENLTKICNEIFSEENFVSTIVWERAFAPVNLKKHFSPNHDYVLCYAKNIDLLVCNGLKRTAESNDRYSNPDNDSRGPWTSGDFSVGPRVEKNVYEIVTPSGRVVLPPSGRCWRVTKEKFDELVADNRVWFGEHGDNVPRIKRFLSEVKQGITLMTVWKYEDVGHSQEAKHKLKELFNGKAYFDYPKSINLIKQMMELYTDDNDIILDFFAGSSTTAHAMFTYNVENNKNNKFILIQIPEETSEKSEAYADGYFNICEIGKERIRLAGDKIVGESGQNDLDTGFKVFKLDSSNLEKWDPDYNDIQQSLLIDEIKKDRTNDDLVFEIMIKYGVDLTLPIEKHNDIYSIGYGALVICLEDNITKEITEKIIKIVESSSIARVVFKDSGFASDADKTNIKEILKTNHIDEFITI